MGDSSSFSLEFVDNGDRIVFASETDIKYQEVNNPVLHFLLDLLGPYSCKRSYD